ncbi:NADH-quinone oxidoreductase subunit F [Moraxella ovis]|nr:NADH-quinone oxidoreductase subunit F [Moraxella ovis]
MDFDPIMKAGSRLGTCLMMVVDETQDMVSLSRNLQQFFQRESCGWCTPCRDGLPWGVKILDAMENGQGQADDIEQIVRADTRFMAWQDLCAHAPGAMEPLMSALRYFRHEFEAKVGKSEPQDNKVGA